jgi:prevent-host-death family protein
MTRTRGTSSSGRWALQDAKARLSEVVRKAQAEGPQRITVHGREEAVVVSAEEYRRLKGDRSGEELVEALRTSPLGDVDFDRESARGGVRGAEL